MCRVRVRGILRAKKKKLVFSDFVAKNGIDGHFTGIKFAIKNLSSNLLRPDDTFEDQNFPLRNIKLFKALIFLRQPPKTCELLGENVC